MWRGAFAAARGNAIFAKLLAEASGDMPAGLQHVRRPAHRERPHRSEDGGLFGIVSTARVLAVCHHLLERSTPARLAAAAALGRNQRDLEALARAQAVFLDLILEQQLADVQAGLPPSNKVAVKRLTGEQRKSLREALGAVGHLDDLMHDLLF